MRRQNLFLKCFQLLELSIPRVKELRSFDVCNKGSLGQRTAKLLAVNVGILKKNSAASAITAKICASVNLLGLISTGLESFSKLD